MAIRKPEITKNLKPLTFNSVIQEVDANPLYFSLDKAPVNGISSEPYRCQIRKPLTYPLPQIHWEIDRAKYETTKLR